jgi:glutathione synthase/RimK-type ligase-like ATP-grasp enzyme
MLVLLSDGAGLTARQCATVLDRAGHQVEALSSAGLCLVRMTRHVRRVHAVPAIGRDPFGWLDAALGVAARRGADVLLPVQEQVAVMSLARERIEAMGLATAVPGFGALAQVQDKVSAHRTLTRVGLPQPPAVVAATAAELAGAAGLGLPAFVKTPIGTASAGVRQVTSPEALRRLAADYELRGRFGQGGVLVQRAVTGPLVMVQSVFAHGELAACHACQRVREGASGGASHKLGLDLPEAREQLARLGAALDWHGALSADVILGPDGLAFIDINPRLVEPVNALESGVDLVRAMLEVARSGSSRPQPPGRPGARTHQLLLAILGAAGDGGRRGVARELRDGLLHRGDYRGSREELTPRGGDLLAGLPVALTAAATLARPAAWQDLAGGSTGSYSLTPAAWEELTRARAPARSESLRPDACADRKRGYSSRAPASAGTSTE